VPVPGITELIRQLAERWSIAVVSNTHDRAMVPRMLDDMAIRSDPAGTHAIPAEHRLSSELDVAHALRSLTQRSQ
jgi:beta-phosphoglucomutase-like phosphatase (HAD superfamily)